MTQITIPFNYTPRPYQLPLLKSLDSGIKRAVCVWHRRAGKDKTFINIVAKRALERVGTYFYLFPTYAQGKKVIWDGMDGKGFKFRSHFPPEIVANENSSEMKLTLINGSIVQVVGTDNVDAILGTNPIGCVFSEYSLQNPIAWDLLRPILRENGGWAIFNYTSRGKNHGYDLYMMAKQNPDWFVSLLTVKDTQVLSEADIQAERDAGMDEELIQQEFYCSFEGSIQGAFYSKEIKQAHDDGRITSVPYQSTSLVSTYWDIGMDTTAIWFVQAIGKEIHVIDYYDNTGEGLPLYAELIKSKPYHYADHWGPHDIESREWAGGGRSRVETARDLGLNFRVTPTTSIVDGIHAARMIFSQCWFDKTKCAQGLKALENYHKEYDDKRKIFRSYPVHDWSSHGSDAFRYFAVNYKPPQKEQKLIYKDTKAYV